MIDLTAACQRTADVLTNVTDEQLNTPTPCEKMRVNELVAHVGGLALAFTAAARKDFGPLTDTPPKEGAQPLDNDWRTAYPARLAELASAWHDPDAWQGMTRAGGVDFPGEFGGVIALTEVVVHGWDVAAATGQDYDIDTATADTVLPHVSAIAAEGPTEGLFGPAVPIPDDAPVLDRIIALSGRDPAWRAP
ncbi:MAG: TIGR03086 family metal-binding protein [Mycobacterium sp.]